MLGGWGESCIDECRWRVDEGMRRTICRGV